jgi:peroxiredoxin Q/BCP
MTDINIGDDSPEFSLPSTDGSNVISSDLRGSTVVLYFYPKDDTPGCTKEACGFRDNYDALTEKGVIVLGVSRDSIESHNKFTNKYSLPFPLLTDPEAEIAKKFGAYGEKKMYGRVFEGVLRQTFLINKDGIVEKIWRRVKTATHAEEVLTAVEALSY